MPVMIDNIYITWKKQTFTIYLHHAIMVNVIISSIYYYILTVVNVVWIGVSMLNMHQNLYDVKVYDICSIVYATSESRISLQECSLSNLDLRLVCITRLIKRDWPGILPCTFGTRSNLWPSITAIENRVARIITGYDYNAHSIEIL